jgi:hypothetical protein
VAPNLAVAIARNVIHAYFGPHNILSVVHGIEKSFFFFMNGDTSKGNGEEK